MIRGSWTVDSSPRAADTRDEKQAFDLSTQLRVQPLCEPVPTGHRAAGDTRSAHGEYDLRMEQHPRTRPSVGGPGTHPACPAEGLALAKPRRGLPIGPSGSEVLRHRTSRRGAPVVHFLIMHPTGRGCDQCSAPVPGERARSSTVPLQGQRTVHRSPNVPNSECTPRSSRGPCRALDGDRHCLARREGQGLGWLQERSRARSDGRLRAEGRRRRQPPAEPRPITTWSSGRCEPGGRGSSR